MRYSVLLFAILSIPTIAYSATIVVPDDYPTIQEAIDAAVNGDTVLVKPGTYVENIDYLGKAITVTSEQGADVTVIDGNQAGSVVTCQSGEQPDSVLVGFKITKGEATQGGGIYCSFSSPTIKNNTIRGNVSDDREDPCGGGIACMHYSSPTILNNLICWNTATDSYMGSTATSPGYGGGIYVDDTSLPLITNNVIFENNATPGWSCFGQKIPSYGGGIYCSNSALVISNTVIWCNTSTYDLEISGDPEVKHCIVKGGWPGTGNIDSDPLFVDPYKGDFHLTFNSPCRGSGDNSVVTELYDFEGDPRICQGTVDIGADECYRHLYCMGDFTPGGSIEGKFIGLPGTTPVGLFIGSGVLPSPMPTMWGEYWLQAPWFLFNLYPIPGNGILEIPTTLPGSIPAPYDIPMQALIGLNANSLSNLCVLEVR